jgi:DNA-directed RNA polymerase specialized sigma24 family protein
MNRSELTARIEEAYWTWRKLPDKERRFLRAKMASWPVFLQQITEAYGWNDARAPKEPPSPEAIDRADEVVGWFARHLREHPKGALSLWLVDGKGMSLSQVSVVMHCSKSAVASRRDRAIAVLLSRLTRERPIWLDMHKIHV